MTGAQIREVLEQSFTLTRGMMQASGLRASYDMRRPPGQRLVELTIGGRPVDDTRSYRVATNSFIANGGDLYATFTQTRQEDSHTDLAPLVMAFLRKHRDIQPPQMGRLVSFSAGRPKMDARRASK